MPAFREIENDDEREICQRLTYQQYRRMGYIPANAAGLHVPPCHVRLSTQILVATVDDQILATATLVWESPLPCESVYREDVAKLRSANPGAAIGEITAVAGDPSAPSLLIPKFLRWACGRLAVDEILCGCCHPHHEEFWRRFLGFYKPEQEIRFACHVGGAPAVWGYMRRGLIDG